jgi:hypothetical protein
VGPTSIALLCISLAELSEQVTIFAWRHVCAQSPGNTQSLAGTDTLLNMCMRQALSLFQDRVGPALERAVQCLGAVANVASQQAAQVQPI